MSDAPQEEPKIIIDSDWKEEAQREKERLSAGEEAATRDPQAGMPAASLLEIVELLATQAIISLQGAALPTGERIPPNLEAAQRFVDLLDVLDEKTKGNRTDEEDHRLALVLSELHQVFARMMMGSRPGAAPASSEGEPPFETT